MEFDRQYERIVSSLLGRTAVAEDIDSAAVIAKKYGYKFRIVTLDGQIVNAGGSFTGGSAVHSAGVFSRKNELDNLSVQIKELNERLEDGNEKIHKLSEAVQRLSVQLDEVKAEQTEILQDKIRFESELSRAAAMEKQAIAQLSDYKSRFDSLKERKDNSEILIRRSKEKLKEIEALIKISEENLARDQGRKESIRSRREELSAEMSSLRIKSAELVKDRQSAERELESLKAGSNEAIEGLKKLEEEEKQLEASIEEKKSAILQRKNSLGEISGLVSRCV